MFYIYFLWTLLMMKVRGLASVAVIKNVKAGHVICNKEQSADAFYYILSGSVFLFADAIGKVGELGDNDSFGELPHIKSQHHGYTAVAHEASELVVINKKTSSSLFADARESQLNDTMQFLRGNALFINWPRSRLMKLCGVLRIETYAPNGIIVRQVLICSQNWHFIQS